MIKSRKLNRFTKGIIITGVLLILFSTLKVGQAMRCQAAGNYHDTVFEYEIDTDECEITDVSTPLREKWDYTSSYVHNNRSWTEISYIRVYSEDGTNCTYGESERCAVGVAKYLPNLIKERGYSYARLEFDPHDGHHNFIHILWSPDSI